jgi:hypothetical protein
LGQNQSSNRSVIMRQTCSTGASIRRQTVARGGTTACGRHIPGRIMACGVDDRGASNPVPTHNEQSTGCCDLRRFGLHSANFTMDFKYG